MPQQLIAIDPNITVSYKDMIIDENTLDCMHFHDGYELVLSSKANNECFLKDTGYSFGDRTLIFVPIRLVHIIKYKEGTQYTRYVANFSHDFIESVLCAMGMPNLLSDMSSLKCLSMQLSPMQYSGMSALFHELYVLSNKEDGSLAEAKGYLSILLLQAYKFLLEGQDKQPSINAKPSKLVREVVAYIDENFSDTIALDELAKRFFVSKYYLCHIFTRITGSGVVDYIQCRRVIEAQKMLMMGGFTNSEVAEKCGFNNMQHFYRVFKRVTGYSPGNFKLPDEN